MPRADTLRVSIPDLVLHVKWLARGGNDKEALTEEYYLTTMAAVIVSIVALTDEQEKELLAGLGLKWISTPMGRPVLTKA